MRTCGAFRTSCPPKSLCENFRKVKYFARKVPAKPLILLAQGHFAKSVSRRVRKVRRVKQNQWVIFRKVTLRKVPPYGWVLRCAPLALSTLAGGCGSWMSGEMQSSILMTNCQAERFPANNPPMDGALTRRTIHQWTGSVTASPCLMQRRTAWRSASSGLKVQLAVSLKRSAEGR